MPSVNTHAMQRLISNLSPDELLAWEDEGEYSVPSPSGGVDAAPSTPNAIDRYSEAMKKKTDYESARPRESDFKPNVLQRVLAGAANFGAGYVNAGGRVKVDPRATQQLTQSLMRPGYSRAMGEWLDQGIPVDAEMEQAGNEYKISEAQRRAKMEQDRATAYGKAQGASESLSRRREEALSEDPWRVSPTGHKMYQSKSGTVKDIEGPKPPPPVKETPAEAATRREKEVETDQVLTPEQKRAYVLTGRIPAKPKPTTVKGPRTDKPRIGTVGQFSGVENKKSTALRAAESAHIKRFKTGPTPMPEAESLAILESDKQRSMEGYDAGVETLGGSVAPRGQQAGPAPAPAQKKYTEAEARDAAIKAGKDPNYVVAEMRKKGLL